MIGSDFEMGSIGCRDEPGLLTQIALARLLAASFVGCIALGKSLNGHRVCPGFENEDSNSI